MNISWKKLEWSEEREKTDREIEERGNEDREIERENEVEWDISLLTK